VAPLHLAGYCETVVGDGHDGIDADIERRAVAPAAYRVIPFAGSLMNRMSPPHS
jgi:hypothetical protein